MSQLIVPLNKSRSDYVYFDISTYNALETEEQGQTFRYSEIRPSPFLDGPPEDYEMSIIRFSIDTDSPVFIPQIAADQADRDKTVYVMSLQVLVAGNYVDYSQNISWIPENESVPLPTPPNQTHNKQAQYSSGYYDCASYNYLMYLLTVSAKQLMNQAGVAITEAPTFTWNESDDTMSILFPASFNQTVSIVAGEPVLSTPLYKLYFNIPLFQLFNTLPAIFKGYNKTFGVTPNFNYYIASKDIQETNKITGTTQDLYITKQETSTGAILSPFSCLVFTSNSLPIIASSVSPPQRYVNGTLLIAEGNGNDQANIITDIRTASNVYSPSVLYEPSSEYRWVTLLGNTKLYKLDIEVYYRLKTGDLYPVRLKNNSNFNMKLVFKKK